MLSITLSPAFGIKKAPLFNTIAQETAAFQGSVFVSTTQFPVWKYTIDLPRLMGRADDTTSPISQLLSMFFRCKGRAGTFLLKDPDDFACVAAQFGVGDGVSKTFQLVRPIGSDGDVDIVQNVNGGPPVVSINGATTTAFAIDSRAVITFNVAPAAAAVLTATFNYDFRLRFDADTLSELTQFFAGQWMCSTISLTSVIL
jgi:uncharacterized protein (TIGR02217 family)